MMINKDLTQAEPFRVISCPTLRPQLRSRYQLLDAAAGSGAKS